jgi:hypothetical protein
MRDERTGDKAEQVVYCRTGVSRPVIVRTGANAIRR